MKRLDRAYYTMHVQPLWSLMGPGNGRRLRIYGFTDLVPSLPLPRADPETRNCESSYRRPRTARTVLIRGIERSAARA